MKTVYLMRHGKSDWDSADDDHERPLTRRGMDAARRAGRLLSALGQVPDRLVASTAVRARETARLAAKAGGWPAALETERGFYDAGPEDLLAWVRGADDAAASLMLVGHQPTWALFAEGLIGGGSLRFPTAALARIDLHVERWGAVEFGAGELVWFQLPRVLKAMEWPVDL